MIAIVDDDGGVRTSTANLMRSVGLDAVVCASSEELLGSSRLAEVACVITDAQMPGMSGFELQALLVARGYTIPVIFITAYPEERARRCALGAGAVGFFAKPFDGGALIDCVYSALAARD
jgi:FixJ family two-component response regulator